MAEEEKKLMFKDCLYGLWGLGIVAALVYSFYDEFTADKAHVIQSLTLDYTIEIGRQDSADFRTDKDYKEKRAFVTACADRNAAFMNCGIYSIAEDKIFWVYQGILIDTNKKVGGEAILKPGGYTVRFGTDGNFGHYVIYDANDVGVLKGWALDSIPDKIGYMFPLIVFEKISDEYVSLVNKDFTMSINGDFASYEKREDIDFLFSGMVLDVEAKTAVWQEGQNKVHIFNITNLKPEGYEAGFCYGRIKYTREGECLEVSKGGRVILSIMPDSSYVQKIRNAFGENYCVAVITKDSFKE